MSDAYKTHGALSWCELLTSDVDKAKTFYQQVLGWKMEQAPIPEMEYTLVKAQNGESIGGIMKRPDELGDVPPYWGCYITVNDVDDVVSKAEKAGARILMPPTDIPEVGRLSTFQDPQGAVLSVITYAEQ